nr:hypothetical protein GCM10020093_036650 [Planobispora longispora]
MTSLPDLESLRLLVDVDRLGSLGQAARAAGIAQPSASKRIALLERRLGLSLLERTPRGSTLTSQGTMIVAWAAQVLAAAEELMRGAQAVRHARAAHLHIAASMTVAEYLLPRWLGSCRAASRRCRSGWTCRTRRRWPGWSARRSGGSSWGSWRGRRCRRGWPPGWWPPTAWWWWSRRAIGGSAAAPRCSPPSWPRPRWWSGSGVRHARDPGPGAGRSRRGGPRLELGSNAAVKGAAGEGAAPAVLSGYAVEAELATGRLVEVATQGIDLERRLHAIWRRGRTPTGPAATLLAISLAASPR